MARFYTMSEEIERIKTLIIGSGPAGYTAAIYAARADLKPVVYTGMEPGGQLTTTTEVDNFPGYPEGVDGPSMMVDLQKQAERFGTEVRIGMITSIELSDEPGGIHKAVVDEKKHIEAETVIISTGASAKYLGLPSEQRLRGGGVSACAVCDGFFYKGQEVAIVGGGDTAAEEASYLANICKKVTMLVRKDHMRASKAMQHRVNSLDNIEIRYKHRDRRGAWGSGCGRHPSSQQPKQGSGDHTDYRIVYCHWTYSEHPDFLRGNWTWMPLVTSSQKANQRKRTNPGYLLPGMFRIRNTVRR